MYPLKKWFKKNLYFKNKSSVLINMVGTGSTESRLMPQQELQEFLKQKLKIHS